MNKARSGSLLIIGGSEDRTGSRDILQRLVALAGGSERKFVVLTAASGRPEHVFGQYASAFRAMGVHDLTHVRTSTPEQAQDADLARLVRAADGILMTGGDQQRLCELLGGSAIERAMHDAFESGRACVAGTSAGASALSAQMVIGPASMDEGSAAGLGKGLGFVSGVIIDQHFSQRNRLGRLLGLLGQHPSLMGAGIDENTALIVQPGVGIEVIGQGTVSVVDCRRAVSNVSDIAPGAPAELLGIQLHVLPAGSAFQMEVHEPGSSMLSRQARPAPRQVQDFVSTMMQRSRAG